MSQKHACNYQKQQIGVKHISLHSKLLPIRTRSKKINIGKLRTAACVDQHTYFVVILELSVTLCQV